MVTRSGHAHAEALPCDAVTQVATRSRLSQHDASFAHEGTGMAASMWFAQVDPLRDEDDERVDTHTGLAHADALPGYVVA